MNQGRHGLHPSSASERTNLSAIVEGSLQFFKSVLFCFRGVWVGVCMYARTICMQYPQRPKEGIRSPGTGATGKL